VTPDLERVLRRDRLAAGTALGVLCLLAWAYLLSGAGMSGASAMPDMGMRSAAPTWSGVLLAFAMWSTMMVAMMIPSAAPTVLLYQRVLRHAQAGGGSGLSPTGMFAAGYLLAWLGFSLLATVLQIALQQAALLAPESLGSQSRWLSGAVLVAAGAYQLSPMKNRCLTHCRAPAAFLSQHWRPGALGALRLGALHGAYCVGCCGLLMTLLFVGGVMNLALIAALALLVMGEKLLPGGPWLGRAAAVGFMVWGGATILA